MRAKEAYLLVSVRGRGSGRENRDQRRDCSLFDFANNAPPDLSLQIAAGDFRPGLGPFFGL